MWGRLYVLLVMTCNTLCCLCFMLLACWISFSPFCSFESKARILLWNRCEVFRRLVFTWEMPSHFSWLVRYWDCFFFKAVFIWILSHTEWRNVHVRLFVTRIIGSIRSSTEIRIMYGISNILKHTGVRKTDVAEWTILFFFSLKSKIFRNWNSFKLVTYERWQ